MPPVDPLPTAVTGGFPAVKCGVTLLCQVCVASQGAAEVCANAARVHLSKVQLPPLVRALYKALVGVEPSKW